MIEQLMANAETALLRAYREAEAYEEALTPSAETKAAYIGEFKFTIPEEDAAGEVRDRTVFVPWTTVKDIMKAIREHAQTRRRA